MEIVLGILSLIVNFFKIFKGKTPEQNTIGVLNEQLKIVADRDVPDTDNKLHDGKF